MNSKKLMHFQKMLLDEKKALIDDLIESNESVNDLLEDENHNVNDFVDQASFKVTHDLLEEMSKNNQVKIISIEAALRRISEKTYGICSVCGMNIEEERLEAIPWTSLCIKCKKSDEKKLIKNYL